MMHSNQTYDPFYDRMVKPVLSFAFLPKKCHISGKRIWLKKGYKLVRLIAGPGDPVTEYRWHDVKEHLFWQLTR